MISSLFPGGLGNQIGIRHLICRDQMAINPQQSGKLRVRGKCVAQPDITDGLHAMCRERDDSIKIPIGAALIIGCGMDKHDGPTDFATAEDNLVFRERLAKGFCAPRAGGGSVAPPRGRE